MKKLLIGSIFGLCAGFAWGGSPWVYDEDQSSLKISYVTESFDEKWIGDESASPIAEISQQTLWLQYVLGYSESLTVEVITGYTQSDMDQDTTHGDFSGLADTTVAATMQLMNEFDGDMVTLSVRGEGILRGSYDRSSAGNPHAPGDKANGLSLALLAGKIIGSRYAVYGELGYRARFNDTPDDLFYGVGASATLNSTFKVNAYYLSVAGQSGPDIGASDWTPGAFHETKEERDSINVSLDIAVDGYNSVSLGAADVLDGRNSGDSQIFFFSYNYSF